MEERQKCSYVAELTNSGTGQRIEVVVDLENVGREKAEKIIREMEVLKDKLKKIMAE